MYPYCKKDNEVFERWRPVEAGHRSPTPDETQLMAAVQQALDSGLFYESDVQKYVREHADFIPSEAWQVRGATEGGVMGYECFHARSAMRAIAERAENEEAVKAYHIGQKIGVLYINGKRITSLVIVKIEETKITMQGKAGGNIAQIWIMARAVKTAKERAIARGWCKS